MWKIASATAIGTSHRKAGIPCQDAGLCQVVSSNEGEILLAVVSDGAGSALKSELGSKIVTESFMRHFKTAMIDKSFVLKWRQEVCGEMQQAADAEGLSLRDLACTILGAVVGEESAIFFQIGDGAIVYAKMGEEKYREVFWPQHGEFANQTNFIVQENAGELLEYAEIKGRVAQIALFTDGMERLILDFSQRRVHSPALQPIFEWLKSGVPDSAAWRPTLTLRPSTAAQTTIKP